MAIRPILIHPDRRLRKVAEPVESVDDSVRALFQDLSETMYDAPGIGLAAPQIGVLRRALVMDCARDDDAPELRSLANPVILASSEETETREEGCLSLPEVLEDVTRPTRVVVRYLDEEEREIEAEFEGLEAVCVQHEIDHLNGRLIIDNVGVVKRRLITNRLRRMKREAKREEEL